MKKGLLNVFVSCLLLFAVTMASIPIHQIFHKHLPGDHSKELAERPYFKKIEKPCCKAFVSFHAVEAASAQIFFVTSTVEFIYLSNSVRGSFNSYFTFSNKAPPVKPA
jgi:hypothetical protein